MAVVLATKTAEVNKRSTNLYHAHTWFISAQLVTGEA